MPESGAEGRRFLVTGANAGIGKATAEELARRGGSVVMVCRSPERGEAAREEIRAATGNDGVDLLIADLSSRRQVRGLADEVGERYDRLDVLVNNAGVITKERRLTEDGFEWQFAVNHLAPFLLTNLLRPLLASSAPSRVVNVASKAHRGASLDFEDLQMEREEYRPLKAYGRSKLANLLFTLELARRLEGTGVTANALHPGVVSTKLLFTAARVTRFLSFLFRSPERGARTSVYLATSPEVDGVTGQYFVDGRPREPSPEARDPDRARRLWEESRRLVGLP